MTRLPPTTLLVVVAITAFACAPNGETDAGAPSSSTTAAPSTSADVVALTQMDREWIEAIQKKDAATLERIIADDWVGIDMNEGRRWTKAETIAELKSEENRIESFTLDSAQVRVFGDVAVVTGGDTRKSQYEGTDSSGRYVWTDVYVKRDGRWQAVASQWARVGQPQR